MCENIDKYLMKFEDKYKVTKDDSGLYIILGKFGQIEPGEYKNQNQLVCWGYNPSDLAQGLSKRKMGAMLRRLEPIAISIQQLEIEFLIEFHEKDIDLVCDVIKPRRKRRLSPQAREAARKRALKTLNGK